MSDSEIQELLNLNQRLLNSIADCDWAAYEELCDPTLTAFEPEGRGQLVTGLQFHKFYFDIGGIKGAKQTTMCNPQVRVMGNVAVVAYVRLTQRLDPGGGLATTAVEETRIWHRHAGKWKHVHFHRSAIAP